MPSISRMFILVVATTCIALFTPPIKAGFIPELTLNYVQTSEGWLYQYTLSNPSDSDYALASFTMHIAEDAALSDIEMPDGWYAIYETGFSSITWGVKSLNYVIMPGHNAAFEFRSSLEPTRQSVFFDGVDEDGSELITVESSALAPGSSTAVAEPSSLIYGVIVMCLGGVYASCRRWAKAPTLRRNSRA